MKKLIIASLMFFSFSCNHKVIPTTITTLPEDWTLVPIPNSLDQIGTIFAIKGNKQTYIPDELNVSVKSGIAEPASRQITKSLDLDFLLSFLGTVNVDLSDTNHIASTFDISNAVLVRPTKTLSTAFEERKNDILKDLNFYNLDNSSVYLVTELIKSKTVNISFKKQTEAGGNISNLITKIVNLKKAGVSFDKNDSTSLKYNLKDSLTIFYKLTKIELKQIKFRDPLKKDSIVNVTLTNTSAILDSQAPYKKQ